MSKMTKTRDEKFKLAFDSFIREDIGVNEYKLKNLTKNKGESRHIYEFSVMKQNKHIGFVDRSGITHIGDDVANMNITSDNVITEVYTPIKEEFEDRFNQVFEPYKDAIVIRACNRRGDGEYKHYRSYVEIIKSETNDDGISGKLCVVYHKQHIPYHVIKDDTEYRKKYLILLKQISSIESELEAAFHDIDELQDDLLYNERQLRLTKKVLHRERNLHKLSESNLVNKLRQAYIKMDVKEDCPICYETIDDIKLVIPRCAHYICNDCHPRCNECPICRSKYDSDN